MRPTLLAAALVVACALGAPLNVDIDESGFLMLSVDGTMWLSSRDVAVHVQGAWYSVAAGNMKPASLIHYNGTDTIGFYMGTTMTWAGTSGPLPFSTSLRVYPDEAVAVFGQSFPGGKCGPAPVPAPERLPIDPPRSRGRRAGDGAVREPGRLLRRRALRLPRVDGAHLGAPARLRARPWVHDICGQHGLWWRGPDLHLLGRLERQHAGSLPACLRGRRSRCAVHRGGRPRAGPLTTL